MPPTRNGVYHDAEESPWSYELQTVEHRVVFKFSTRGHYMRFANTLPQRVEAMSATMGRRIGVPIDMELPAALQLYRQVETFGFYLEVDGEPCRKRDCLLFDGPRLRRQG